MPDYLVVYVAGRNRPAQEVLLSNRKPPGLFFENEFVGMTDFDARQA